MKEPEPKHCSRCDFSLGRRGMDLCSTCEGTGSVFIVNGKTFPNTKEGFEAAVKAQEAKCN